MTGPRRRRRTRRSLRSPVVPGRDRRQETIRRGGRNASRTVALLVVVLGFPGCSGPEAGSGTSGFGGSPENRRPVPAAATGAGFFGFGARAGEEEIERWNVDVGPDGDGLPPGSGTVAEGAAVYESSCAHCHGAEGLGGPYGAVVATQGAKDFPFGRDPSLTASIGNYWPYATTVFDYTRRAMPFDDPGSLTDEEVYAVTGWLLWRNGLVEEDAVMDASTLPAVEMPAREHFVPSDDVSLPSLP